MLFRLLFTLCLMCCSAKHLSAQHYPESLRIHCYSATKEFLDPQTASEFVFASSEIRKQLIDADQANVVSGVADGGDMYVTRYITSLGANVNVVNTLPAGISLAAHYFSSQFDLDVVVSFSADSSFKTIRDLLRDASEHQYDYILLFPEVKIGRNADSMYYCDIHLNLFSAAKKRLIADTIIHNTVAIPRSDRNADYAGNIGKTLGEILKTLESVIATNESIAERKEQLKQNRETMLRELYNKPVDATIISKVLPPDDPRLEHYTLYQCLYNREKTKFIGFYADRSHPKSKNENELVPPTASGNLSDDASTNFCMAYKGVLYQGKWYVMKIENRDYKTMIFDTMKFKFFSETLARGFIKKHTPYFDTTGWISGDFDTVIDYRKFYGISTYVNDALGRAYEKMKDYIGIPVIVAEEERKKH